MAAKETSERADDALVYSISETKRRLNGFSHQRVYDLINQGVFKTFKEGRRRFVLASSVRDYIQNRLQETA